ncbi:hypothetical protein M758_7G129700 [Ceratodon purpureus]|uniref:Uncharacterized protein n=1 Tax=Ceratodon purpureus TaxID=3225 RepID=A0A8T0HF03_CERPU|nr:hypothetical protein KC19_7G147300 [Ceratodon purpureus]KAG0611295.1 hypothetical protein M758_7G129700 [Ceratodon purpureus]
MPSRGDSRDLALTIEEEFKKIYSSVSFTIFKGKVFDYDSSLPETAFLSPDQDAVNTFFLRTGGLLRPEVRNVLEAFFNSTVKACKLYRVLLKGIQKARQSQSSLNQALELVHKFQQEGNIPNQSLHDSVLEELNKFAASENPFSQETLDQFQVLQEYSEQLEREFGGMKHMLDTKLRKERALSKVLPFLIFAAGSPILLCLALPAALAGIVVSNVTDDAMATLRGWWSAVRGRFSNSELEAQCAQLDAADKGSYIIIHDLMTIKRLVTRLRNDVESSKRRILFFEEAMQDYGSMCVIVHQMRINTANSEQQMKDFSEQVVLCCRTIEKARKLVFEKITGEPWHGPMEIFTDDAGSSDDDV